MTERKIIKKLPAQWPLKGNIRVDHGDIIVLMHPDRKPMKSTDGVSWEEINLANKADNQMMFQIEKRRLAR